MNKKGFKEFFVIPWLRGAAFSLLLSVAFWIINFAFAAVGLTRAAEGGIVAAVLILAFIPWIGGSAAKFVVEKVK